MFLWGARRAEAKRLRDIQQAKDDAYAAWSAAINAHNDAKARGDTRDINRTYERLRDAMNDMMRLVG